jgi:hypothetical protein
MGASPIEMLDPGADDTTMETRRCARTLHPITGRQRQRLHGLEGQTVSVALVDGSRIDDATLVSAGRSTVPTLWLYSNGADVFVPFAEVVDLWQSRHRPKAA